MNCPRCQADNPAGARFCGQCAAPLVAACRACGAVNPPSNKFCGQCAAPLEAPAQPRFAAPESYTPRHLADRILTSRPSLEGERKQVTVLFADLKGSMELLADRDPEEARRILDPVLELMMAAVHRYEGTVNQVMGDGVMALFGAPLAHEDHAVRACYAALRMQDAVREHSTGLRRSQGVEVQIRVGINSGEVVVRSIGSDLRMDYTAVGQTTHLAARMEQLAPPGTIRLAGETLRLADGFVQVRPLGPIPVKGLAEPVEAYELTAAAAVRTRLQAARARGFTRFVGRDAEIEQIRQAAEQARRGRGQVVAVVGEPGVGKSRLFHEFLHSHHMHGWLVLEASSVSYGKATPFLPLADLLRVYLRVEDRDDTRTVRARVTGTILTLDRALEESIAPVTWLLDALPPDDAFLALEPARRRQRAIDSAKHVLLRESRVQPLVVVFEDLHWIDAETQSFLDGLVESLPTAPVLLAVNYRPEYRHQWGGKTYYRQLRIDPLAAESADELLAAVLGDDSSVQPLKSLLIARTEGNPLFLEESVRTLAETRVLEGEPGRYRLARPVQTIQIPATVQAILAARIDRLDPALKRLLQAASVVGKNVPLALLEAIAELPAGELRAALGELQAAEFLYEMRLFPDVEYTFKHALTHETAYGSVLQERRRALHAALVTAIEELYADRLGEQVELLAHHAARGGIPDKTVHYLRLAGEKAIAHSAMKEAVEFLEAALQTLRELPDTPATLSQGLDVRIALGPALISIDGAASPRVREVYDEALALVERLGDVPRRFPVMWGRWFISYTVGEYAAAREAGTRLLEDAQRGDDSGRLVEAHHALWPTFLAMGHPSEALLHAERGIALYRRERHAGQASLYAGHDAGACCRYQRAIALWQLGYPDRALDSLRDAERLAGELNQAQTSTIILWFSVVLRLLRGERTAAAQLGERLAEAAEAHRFTHWSDIAIVIAPPPKPGVFDAATLAQRHERLMSLRTAIWRRVFCLCHFAQLALEAGYPELAGRALASIDQEYRDAFQAPEIERLEGDVLAQTGRPAEAEARLRRAIGIAQARAQKSFELRATLSLATVLAERGRRDEGRAALAAIHGWFGEGFETRDLRTAAQRLRELSGGS
ncbi:MAG TPA: adenylate/guanylate cyclase domain-containing protein [Methylomirabilota bacterium]|nr:adenylate/guanylate cyclase domain-containing protein [Methylomirabilota bacterium]